MMGKTAQEVNSSPPVSCGRCFSITTSIAGQGVMLKHNLPVSHQFRLVGPPERYFVGMAGLLVNSDPRDRSSERYALQIARSHRVICNDVPVLSANIELAAAFFPSPGVHACGSEGHSSQSFFFQAPFTGPPEGGLTEKDKKEEAVVPSSQA